MTLWVWPVKNYIKPGTKLGNPFFSRSFSCSRHLSILNLFVKVIFSVVPSFFFYVFDLICNGSGTTLLHLSSLSITSALFAATVVPPVALVSCPSCTNFLAFHASHLSIPAHAHLLGPSTLHICNQWISERSKALFERFPLPGANVKCHMFLKNRGVYDQFRPFCPVLSQEWKREFWARRPCHH